MLREYIFFIALVFGGICGVLLACSGLFCWSCDHIKIVRNFVEFLTNDLYFDDFDEEYDEDEK